MILALWPGVPGRVLPIFHLKKGREEENDRVASVTTGLCELAVWDARPPCADEYSYLRAYLLSISISVSVSVCQSESCTNICLAVCSFVRSSLRSSLRPSVWPVCLSLSACPSVEGCPHPHPWVSCSRAEPRVLTTYLYRC